MLVNVSTQPYEGGTFNIFTNGETVFHKIFDPVTGINTYVQGLSGSIGEISWGRLSGATRSGINPISVEVAGFTVNSGLTTFPYIQRRNAGLRTTGAIEK